MKLNLSQLKFDSRTRFLITVLAIVVLAVIYYRTFYRPSAAYLNDAKERHLSLTEEKARLQSGMPDINIEQKRLADLKKTYDTTYAQVLESEKYLPKNVNIPDILKFLVKDKDNYGLRIISIKSRKDKAQDIPLYTPPPDSKQKPVTYYSMLPIEMEVYGKFDNIIDYIDNIEKRLPYQRLGSFYFDMQKTFEGQPECLLNIVSILGRGVEEDENFGDFLLAMKNIEQLRTLEDPFHKKERPRTEETLAEATLYGIMWKKGKPIAIIDGKGYSEGDTYHNKKIVKIEKDKVTLEEEDKLYKLLIKQ